MPDPLSRRDYPRESHDPSPTKPNQAQLTTSLGHPIHPTTSTSTHERATMDGSTINATKARLEHEEQTLAAEIEHLGQQITNALHRQLTLAADHNTTETTDQSRPVVGLVARVERPDIYELREQGVRVLGDDQCCDLGCDGGACESCPCCCAGWCVAGHSGEIPDPVTDAENYAIWLEEAGEHNPVARRLAEVEAARTADATTIGVLSAAVAKVAAIHVDDGDGWCKACQTLGYPCPTVLALGAGR